MVNDSWVESSRVFYDLSRFWCWTYLFFNFFEFVIQVSEQTLHEISKARWRFTLITKFSNMKNLIFIISSD